MSEVPLSRKDGSEQFGPVTSKYGGDLTVEPVVEGLQIEVDGGQDSLGYTIVSWEDAEALRYWLNWALGARTGRRSGL